jgi:hypothetical protein
MTRLHPDDLAALIQALRVESRVARQAGNRPALRLLGPFD